VVVDDGSTDNSREIVPVIKPDYSSAKKKTVGKPQRLMSSPPTRGYYLLS